MTVLVAAKCQGSEYKTIIKNSDWIYKSAIDNYKIYIKGNVEDYFKEKEKVIERLTNMLEKLDDKTDELISKMNTNFISFIGGIVASLLAYSAKQNINAAVYIMGIYVCYLIISSLYFYSYTIIKFLGLTKDFDSYISLYIDKFIDSDELQNKRERFDNNKSVFKIYYWISIFVILAITLLIYLVCSQKINLLSLLK